MTKTKRKWISIPQAARELDCSHTRVRRILAAGKVSVLRVPGTQPRVNTQDLARFISNSTSAFTTSAA
jgi:excisionase family DNA binding protein